MAKKNESTVVDSRDFTSHCATNEKPRFRSQCPHCGNMHLLTFDDKFTIVGVQRPQVVTCGHNYTETKSSHTTTFQGCGKRYIADIRVDIKVVSVPVEE